MNQRGQALVEFVLILPVFILLVFAFIDAGKVILCQNHLENSMNDVVLMVKDKKEVSEIETFLKNDDTYKIDVSISVSEYTKIVLETKIDLITPGINRIFNENVKIERSIIHE